MKKTLPIVLLITIIISLFTGCSASVPKNFSELDKDEQKAHVEALAESVIKSNLKAPSTAKVEVLTLEPLGENKYEVMGYVDAENSFGAKIRNDFVVQFRVNDKYDEEHDGFSCDVLDIQFK